MDIESLVKELASYPTETEWLEFKTSFDKPEVIGQYISALSNAAAYVGRPFGYVVWGVNDKTHEVVGTDFAYRNTEGEPLEHILARKLNPSCAFSFTEDAVDGKRVVVLKVPAAKTVPTAFDNERYCRIGSSKESLRKYPEREAQLFKILSEAGMEPWDSRSSGKSLDSIVSGVVKRFVAKGNERDRITEEYIDDADVLGSSGLMLEDGTLTNAAATLFCKSSPSFRLTMGVLDGNARTKILDLRQEDGPAFDLIDRAEHFVISNIRRRLVFGNGVARDEIPEIPRSAVREGIINAFCHRDYTDVAAVVIDVFTDTVEITNPGLFPAGKSPEAFIAGKVKPPSRGRNPLISNALFRSGIIEQYGSGIGRIRDACSEAGVKFEYRQDDDCTKLVFHRPGSHLVDDAAIVSEGLAKGALSAREQLALDIAAKEGRVTTGVFAETAGISRQAAAPILRKLAEDRMLVWHGKSTRDPHQYYAITDN